ncbi:MAG: Ig-like domain-containing protein, partial [Limisphaerales bacterium]
VNLTGIGSGAAHENQTLTVTAVSSKPSLIPTPQVTYTSPSATGSLSFTPAPNASGSAMVSVTVNDGGASNNTVVRTFTVTVNAVNAQPTLDAIADVTINENAGAQTVNLTGIGSGAANENQTLTVTAVSSKPSLIPNPQVSYTSPGATGSLSFTPAANASGSAMVSVTVNDGGTSNNTVVRAFTVSVNAGSYPPTLDPIADMTIDENAGAQTMTLTGIAAGSNNVAQFLAVNALSSNPGLIPNPTVSYTAPEPTATLTFSPAANSYGSVSMTVMVDNGAISNNSVIKAFTVTVRPVNAAPTLDPIADVTLDAGAGAQTVQLSGITSGATNEIQELTVTAKSSNPALIPDPTVNYTSPNTNATLNFTPLTNLTGQATVTVTVDDGQPTNSSISRTFVVTVNQAADSPAPLTNAIVAPNTVFSYLINPPYTNGDRFSYSLGAGAPKGVKVSTSRGVTYLTWKPTTAQALTTNLISIVIADATHPNLSTNQTVLVDVLDFLAARLGSVSVQAGQTALLPMYLASSSGVTNLSFTVDWPTTQLTSPTLFITAPGIAASSLQNRQTNLLISLQTAPGQVLQNSNLIAQLSFQVPAGHASAFLTLPIHDISAKKPDSSAYVAYLPTDGQVTIVNNNPLLQPAINSETNRTLTAFGNVGTTYQLQSSMTPTVPTSWGVVMTYAQTNISQTLTVSPSNPLVFYRLQAQ